MLSVIYRTTLRQPHSQTPRLGGKERERAGQPGTTRQSQNLVGHTSDTKPLTPLDAREERWESSRPVRWRRRHHHLPLSRTQKPSAQWLVVDNRQLELYFQGSCQKGTQRGGQSSRAAKSEPSSCSLLLLRNVHNRPMLHRISTYRPANRRLDETFCVLDPKSATPRFKHQLLGPLRGVGPAGLKCACALLGIRATHRPRSQGPI